MSKPRRVGGDISGPTRGRKPFESKSFWLRRPKKIRVIAKRLTCGESEGERGADDWRGPKGIARGPSGQGAPGVVAEWQRRPSLAPMAHLDEGEKLLED